MQFLKPQRCLHCDGELTPHQRYAGGVCSDWKCRQAQLDADIDRERDRANGVLARRDAATATTAEHSVVVPARPSRLRPLSARRRSEFLGNLDEILTEIETSREETRPDRGTAAIAQDPAEDASRACGGAVTQDRSAPENTGGSPAAPDLALSVCAACQGACCHAGGTHAFLTAPRVEEILARDRVPAKDLRRYYEEMLPERSVGGSCVFHTQTGCALPRDRRAYKCNEYECDGLKRARTFFEEGVAAVHVVRREDRTIQDSAVVSADGVRHVRKAGR